MDSIPTEILKKRVNIRIIGEDATISSVLHCLEYEEPYTLSMILLGHSCGRVDVMKDQLAVELQEWLHGKSLMKPAIVVSQRLTDTMMNYIKFGKPPSQQQLFMWMLSRTEIQRRNDELRLFFGGVPKSLRDNQQNENNISSTTQIEPLSTRERNNKSLDSKSASFRERPKSAPQQGRRRNSKGAMTTFAVTQDIIGKSHALSQLPQQKVKGREGASLSYVRVDWTDDHYRLTNHIMTRRQELEAAMETRRKILETSKTRQVKSMEKFRKIRESNTRNRKNYNWAQNASYEVRTLDRINETVQEDIMRQRSRAQRAEEHIRWTMAPNGFVNRRGRYRKGIVIGPGPLPADATTALHDPRIQRATAHYYWDQHGRRHLRSAADIDEQSVVQRAMQAIRKAAVNASLYKLDLKAVFKEMDTSGDGFITVSEMDKAFIRMGLKLDDESLDALFRHFDPNNSGSIHYGEFMWAFFNRRKLVSQWRLATKGLTKSQIRTKFRNGDINGDGKLGLKEFKRLLASFSIHLSDTDVDLLIDRFDTDGDGDLDLHEFAAFIDKEISNKDSPPPTLSASTGGIPDDNDGLPPSYMQEEDDYNDTGLKTELLKHVTGGSLLDNTDVAEYIKSSSLKATDVLDASQIADMFERQSRVEATLGKKYYDNHRV